MNQASTVADRSTSAWRSPWVIGWIALIVVVLLANGTMIFFAFLTNPGLVTEDYYERGREVERTIVTRAQEGPGWLMRIDTPSDVRAGEVTKIRYFVVDKAGQPVTPDQVTYFAYRPSDAARDFSVPMTEEARGRYVAEVRFPLGGVWDGMVGVRSDGEEYVVGQRVSVAAP
jgi:nitrogen fixation protein FixH